MAKLANFSQKLIHSDWYPILIFAMSFSVWLSPPSLYPLAIGFVALLLLVMILSDTSQALIPLLLGILFSNVIRVGDLNEVPQVVVDLPYPLIYGLIAFVVIVMVLFLVRFLITHKGKKEMPKIKLGMGLLAIVVSFTLSKVRLDVGAALTIPYADAILVLLLVGMYLFFLYTNEKDSHRYFAKTAMYFGVFITLQILNYYTSNPLSETFTPTVGWGISNEAANVLLLVLPFSLFNSLQKPRYLVFFFLQIIGIILTLSRGGILFMLFSLVLLFFLLYRYRPRVFKVAFICFGILIGVMYLVAPSQFLFIIEAVTRDGINDSGRFILYRDAWQWFRANPWFGIGTILSPTVFNPTPWFHSTLFDVLASLGVIGMIAFAWHIIQKYWLLLTKRNVFKWFVFVGVLSSGLYGLIDISYFHYVYFFVLILILTFAERSEMEEILEIPQDPKKDKK